MFSKQPVHFRLETGVPINEHSSHDNKDENKRAVNTTEEDGSVVH